MLQTSLSLSRSWLLGLSLTLSPVSAFAAEGQAPVLLEQSTAVLRAKQVQDVHYDLDVRLPESDQPFEGLVTAEFRFQAQGEPLRIDFARGLVQSVTVNDRSVPFVYDGAAIRIEEATLKNGARNQLRISFSHPYSKDGNGLYRFKDPVDQKVYVYTHFEPYKANSFIPCFDQPDLKATYKMQVTAPAAWQVVTGSREETVREQGDQKIWNFARTAKYSTYLLSLHAGPYKIWEDKKFRYPLRLMARQSMAQYVPVQEWLEVTRKGFDYFDEVFAYAYPFQKYDQVIVPDFNAGAMENVAAVTFSERFLVRGERTKAQREGLANTVLHEMAHMWFGNLVTMRWWNDLWLNESFATYASALAMSSLPEYPDTWLGYARSKTGAYYADQLVTTHPIVAEIPDTEAAMSNFDAITYGKGGAFLRLTHSVIGDKAFLKGLQDYFKKHAFGNTEVGDLITAMERSSQRSLQSFTHDWLHTAGPNTLRTEFACEAGRIKRFDLIQTADPEYPTLREHKAVVGLYRRDAKTGLRQLFREGVSYQGARTAWTAAIGQECPDLVFPNEDDSDYVRVQLDAETLRHAQEILHRIDNRFIRVMVWNSLAQSVEDTQISLQDYVRFFSQQFAKERDYEVLRTIDSQLDRTLMPYLEFVQDPQLRTALFEPLRQQIEARLADRTATRDSKMLFFDSYVTLLTLDRQADPLLALLHGKKSWPGLKIEQDERWSLIQGLAALRHPEAVALREKEKARDPSSQGRRQYLAAQARSATYAEKQALLKPIVAAESPLSAADRSTIVGNLFPAVQRELKQDYVASYVQEIPTVVKRLESGVARTYVMSLLPLQCSPSGVPLVEQLLKAHYSDAIQKGLLVARQTNERCMKVMARLKTASS